MGSVLPVMELVTSPSRARRLELYSRVLDLVRSDDALRMDAREGLWMFYRDRAYDLLEELGEAPDALSRLQAGESLVEVELSKYDWPSYECGVPCETAAHFPDDLRALFEKRGRNAFLDCAHPAGCITMDASLPPINVLLAGIADHAPGALDCQLVHYLLLGLVGENDSHWSGGDVGEEARDLGRRGLWLMYAEALQAESLAAIGYSSEVIDFCERDHPQRFEWMRETVAELRRPGIVNPCCQTTRSLAFQRCSGKVRRRNGWLSE